MHISINFFAALIACSNALVITAPASGQALDPTQPITVRWTTTGSDPATFDIVAVDPGSFISDTRLARDVSTAARSYIIPANSIQSYGTGFSLKADASDGTVLATSGLFDLSIGVGGVVNDQPTLLTASTFTGTPASSETIAGATTGTERPSNAQLASSTANAEATASASGSGGSSTLTASHTGFSTSTTGTMARSTTGASSTSSTSATTSANAQPRLASGSQIILSGAGLLAGLAALLA